MKKTGAISLLLVLVYSILANADESEQRKFLFKYKGAVNDVPAGKTVRVWIPVAASNSDQTVEIKSKSLPDSSRRTKESAFGNQMFYFEEVSTGSSFEFEIEYLVTRNEVLGSGGDTSSSELRNQEREQFLQSNKLVPTDGKPVELFGEFLSSQNGGKMPDDKYESAKLFYDWVYEHMTYDKSKPGYGKGDVVWACDSKTGNCTDFHSLFISVARNNSMPAKFEIGFPLPTERGKGEIGGYHCWAKFYLDDKGWIPVDISEADKHPDLAEYYFGNLTENRIHFSTGRDIVLKPKQDSDPVNYFVYPHVEVDGKVLSKEQLKLQFSFEDLD